MSADQLPKITVTHFERSPAGEAEFNQRFRARQEAILQRRRTGLPTAQDAFLEMTKNEIAPRLRELGFRGSGQKFRLPSDSHRLHLDFQRSAWNDILEVRFTINLSANVFDSTPNEDEGAAPRTYRHDERLGFIARGGDHWWVVPADGPTLDTADDVIHDVRKFGVPWLRLQTESDFSIPWFPERSKG